MIRFMPRAKAFSGDAAHGFGAEPGAGDGDYAYREAEGGD